MRKVGNIMCVCVCGVGLRTKQSLRVLVPSSASERGGEEGEGGGGGSIVRLCNRTYLFDLRAVVPGRRGGYGGCSTSRRLIRKHGTRLDDLRVDRHRLSVVVSPV